ncbi:MAG: DUF1028 domain-containing protein [Acidobacteria bacterium]|nr:DUF1028 domain-containing protein [Acidobacteriota bacterium]
MRTLHLLLIVAVVTPACVRAPSPPPSTAGDIQTDSDPNYLGTFSIISRDPSSGELGFAVQSKAFAAGNRAVAIRAGLGVIAHQASANPMYGAIGFELLARGFTPQQALDMMLRSDEGRTSRQVAILDAEGRTASWDGPGANDWKGHKCGANYCAQGNILAGPQVVDALARSFESSSGPLAERLMDALDAAQAAGGDARGMQSAALIITRALGGAGGFSDRVIDIRVDDSRAPLADLRRLLNLYRAGQMITDANRQLTAGDPDTALGTALAARDKAPDNDNAWVAIANIHLKAGRKADALAAIRRAIELNAANRRQLPKNRNFETLMNDPEFKRLTSGSAGQ